MSPDASLPDHLVCFAHGKESGPWGTKITYLAAIARTRGFAVESPDYSHTHDPRRRLAQLLDQPPRARRGPASRRDRSSCTTDRRPSSSDFFSSTRPSVERTISSGAARRKATSPASS